MTFQNLYEILHLHKIIPVAEFKDVGKALKTADMLMENSIPLLEITLRTPDAVKCLHAVKKKFTGMMVGAGSVLNGDDLINSSEAGADFFVSPCFDTEIFSLARTRGLKFIPGIATPGELNLVLKAGSELVKFFPAVNIGGPGYLKAICSPYKMQSFHVIPSGGINDKNIKDFLTLDKVLACNTSFVVDPSIVDAGDFHILRQRISLIKDIIKGF